jgi:hypothetical protein
MPIPHAAVPGADRARQTTMDHPQQSRTQREVARIGGRVGRKLHPSLAAAGWRVRHRMGPHWVKMYDKASVLRVETVINNRR